MTEPTAYACPCGSPSLYIVHAMGAQVSCPRCGRRGPFVSGNNYQKEEAAAIRAWNEDVAAAAKEPA